MAPGDPRVLQGQVMLTELEGNDQAVGREGTCVLDLRDE